MLLEGWIDVQAGITTAVPTLVSACLSSTILLTCRMPTTVLVLWMTTSMTCQYIAQASFRFLAT